MNRGGGRGVVSIARPGQCYLCRKRPGSEQYRKLWACHQCVLSREVQDAFLIVLMVAIMATLVAMYARRHGYCRFCPDVPMPVLHLVHNWTH